MKKPLIIFLSASLCLFALFVTPIKKTFHSAVENEQEEFENEEEGEHETGADKQLASWFQARAYPDPYYLNEKYLAAWEQAKAMRNNAATRNMRVASASWSSIGPSTSIGGRVLSIAIDPNNANNIFIGTASGGIYKTTNASTSCTWTYVPTDLPLLGVASITYHPTSSSILLAGTGEVYRTGNSNIGFNVWKARGTYGIGIIKSTDGGVTWSTVYNKNTSDLWAVQMLKYDPNNSSIVYAAATDGLYKSTDGGDTWSLLYSKTYVSDVAINPANSNQIVIAVGNLVDTDKGIYRTTDGGSTWSKITGGLPASFTGYIRFDNVSSSRLYASIGGSSSGNELYLSTNFGSSWIAKSSSSHCGGQYWFGHDLAVNPSNEDVIFIGGVSYYKYTSTSTTNGNGSKAGTGSGVHADVHDIKFANSTTIYIACDGGVYRSTNSGTNWSNVNNGLSAVQFYASIAPSPTSASIIIGGLQDNGVIKYNGSGWSQLIGGDGGPCAFHPNGTTVLMSNDARAVYISTSTGSAASQKLLNCGYGYATAYDDRTAFMSPVIIAPSDPTIMYAASDNLHISTNTGGSFTRPDPGTDFTRPIEAQYKTAIALGISYTDANKLYVSTSPFSQRADNALNVTGQPNVLRSLNASNNSTYTFSSIKSNLPDRFVMDFAVSKNDDDSVFVALGGFGTSHVWVTGDGGGTWTSIGTGLPDAPFNAILIDPVNPKVLYAAGDLGVYVSPNRGGVWYDYNNGLWDNLALVMDIQANANNDLVLATHGKGVFVGPAYTSTLPVTIVSFTGEALPTSNKLKWTVAQETGVQEYEIERSSNGTDFKKVGSVPASNRSAYSFVDPLTSNQSFYYRLKTVDLDGSYEYSELVHLKRVSKEDVQVLSNPFVNDLKISFTLSQNSKAQISLYDAGGKLVSRKQPALASGQSVYTLNDLSGLPAGTYYLEAVVNNQRWRQKLVKK